MGPTPRSRRSRRHRRATIPTSCGRRTSRPQLRSQRSQPSVTGCRRMSPRDRARSPSCRSTSTPSTSNSQRPRPRSRNRSSPALHAIRSATSPALAISPSAMDSAMHAAPRGISTLDRRRRLGALLRGAQHGARADHVSRRVQLDGLRQHHRRVRRVPLRGSRITTTFTVTLHPADYRVDPAAQTIDVVSYDVDFSFFSRGPGAQTRRRPTVADSSSLDHRRGGP